MKTFSTLSILLLLLRLGTFAQNISTGIDSTGNPLALNALDPFWVTVNSPMLPDTTPQTSTFYAGYWQPTPIAVTGASWINHSGSGYGGTVAGDYTFERRFEIQEGVCAFICNFGLTCDDSIISLALVAPDQSTIPLTVVASSVWYYLSDTIGDTIFNPQVGTWKVRAMINFYDAAAGFLLSGSIDTLQCATPLPLCDSNLVINGDFTLGFHSSNGDGGSFTGCNATLPGSYATNWCGIGSPQYVFFPNSGSNAITMWGVGQDFQTGEGIAQFLQLEKWWSYDVSFDGIFRDLVPAAPDSIILRFWAYDNIPTVVNEPGGILIGEQVVSDTSWTHYTLPIWFAPSTKAVVAVTLHNTSMQNNGAYAAWGGIDNICIQRGIYMGINTPIASENHLVLFPNPAESFLCVRLPEGKGTLESVTVMDMLGRSLDYGVGNPSDGSLSLDVFALPRGSYFLRIRLEGSETAFSGKFLKQ